MLGDVRAERSEISGIFSLSDKQAMIQRASELYQKGSVEDHIWGLQMLISGLDHRFGQMGSLP
ncbi:hypothetical protein MHK_009280 [Candidatus Magnetomorum sp. HK-1]|nr:hypothetical protein MHK_009280 [Candidatus Magnetomorum sp. HK-1]